MSSATSRRISGFRSAMPLSKNSRWNFRIDSATLMIVRWRCWIDRISHCARAQLVLDVVLARGRVAHRVLVEAADLELRQAVVVRHDEVLVADLVDVDVGRDVVRIVGGVLPTRARVELHDHLRGLVDLLERLLQVARDRLVVLLLEVAEVALDHLDAQVVVLAGRDALDQHALGERARADADRIERLDLLEHLLAQLGSTPRSAASSSSGGSLK